RSLFFVIFAVLIFTVTNLLLHMPDAHPACANSKSCNTDLSVKIENGAVGTFAGKKVYPPKIVQTPEAQTLSVLGASSSAGEKHIYVDLSTQTLIAYQGKSIILSTPVSTGRWGKTPTGNLKLLISLDMQ